VQAERAGEGDDARW